MMTRGRRVAGLGGVLAAAILAAPSFVSASPITTTTSTTGFKITVLPADGPAQANAINDRGDAAGLIFGGETNQPVVWHADGSVLPLTLPAGTFDPVTRHINNFGMVVGEVAAEVPGSGYTHTAAVVWDQGGSPVVLPSLPNVPSANDVTQAWSINDSGTIVGNANAARSGGFVREHAVRWDPLPNGGYTIFDLGLLPGGTRSRARDVNQAGLIVGSTGIPDGSNNTIGAVWDPAGNVTLLPSLPGAAFAEATGVNDAGQIAGTSTARSGINTVDHPVRWTGTPGGGYSVSELAGLPAGNRGASASAINGRGQVSGTVFNGNFSQRAVVWDSDGAISDLGTLPGSRSSIALGINDFGQVAGFTSGKNLNAVLWDSLGGASPVTTSTTSIATTTTIGSTTTTLPQPTTTTTVPVTTTTTRPPSNSCAQAALAQKAAFDAFLTQQEQGQPPAVVASLEVARAQGDASYQQSLANCRG